MRGDDEPAGPQLDQACEDLIEVTFVTAVDDMEFEAPRSGFLRSVGETRPCRISSQKPHNFKPTGVSEGFRMRRAGGERSF